MVRVSMSEGQFSSTCSPGARMVAAMSGSAAFLAPLTRTVPFSRAPPRMTRASMEGRVWVSVSTSDMRLRAFDHRGVGLPRHYRHESRSLKGFPSLFPLGEDDPQLSRQVR